MRTEVEIRGPLTDGEYLRTLSFLKKKGKLVKEANQLAIFFRVPKNNFSLKRDHSEEKMVLKFGGWEKGSRREIEVVLKNGQFDNALNLLKGLGFNKGHRVPAFRQDFLYKGIQISLKTKAVIGPHFEMETVIESGRNHSVKRKLFSIAEELDLRVWSEEEYREHTHRKWQAYHPGPERL